MKKWALPNKEAGAKESYVTKPELKVMLDTVANRLSSAVNARSFPKWCMTQLTEFPGFACGNPPYYGTPCQDPNAEVLNQDLIKVYWPTTPSPTIGSGSESAAENNVATAESESESTAASAQSPQTQQVLIFTICKWEILIKKFWCVLRQ